MSRKSKRNKRPPQPPRQGPSQPQSGESAKAGSASFIAAAPLVVSLVIKWLKHHLFLSALLLFVVLFISIFSLVRDRSACVSLSNTAIGSFTTCSPPQAPLEGTTQTDGLHGELYVDRRAGFSLRLLNPDQWSVVQPHELSDGSKTIVFPPGILGKKVISVITDDASVVFVNKGSIAGGNSSVWVFRIPRPYDPIDKFIAEETTRMLRTGSVIIAHLRVWDEPQSALKPQRDGQSTRPSTDERAQLTSVQVSPNKRNAVLIWEKLLGDVPVDVIGRVVAAERDTYYLVTLKSREHTAAENEVSLTLREVLVSFQLL